MFSRLLRGLGLLAYGVLLLVVFALTAYTSFSLFVRSGVTAVPPVEGLTQAEAANRLADQGLRLRGVESRGVEDDKVPAGKVLRQSPEPRTLVKRGSGVSLVLSLGPQRVEVPEVTGRPLPAAQAALSGSGLGLGRILGAFSSSQPAGAVLAQDPSAGDTIAPSTPVDLLLAVPVPGDRYLMPDLVYRDYERVRPYFEQQGFHFGNVKYESYEGVAAGVILRQFPLPGHPVGKQDPISLVIATAESLPETLPGLPGSLPEAPPEPVP
jgi:beta-lactam-binding protein with PASTA domain